MKKITNAKIFALCLGDMSRGLIGGIITSYLLTFFIPTNSNTTLPRFFLNAALTMAIIRGIGTVIDAITDPWVASLSDNCRSPLGRRVVFMRWAAVPYGLFCLLVFFPPVGGQYRPVLEGLMAQRRLLSKYGGHSVKKEGYFKGTVLPILCSPELSLREKLGTAKGYQLCLSRMWPTIVNYDFCRDLHTFEVPYYIFQGRKDENTPASLIQEYYDAIAAPDKDLIWFEHSAHGPLGEEPEKFKAHLREKFLAIERREPT